MAKIPVNPITPAAPMSQSIPDSAKPATCTSGQAGKATAAGLSEPKFIVIEGLEGAGKSTAVATVVQWLKEQGAAEVITTREPGGTPLAEQIRAIVKTPTQERLTDEAELLLMYAARVQLVETVIRPALARGCWVVGDRHDLSSQAYQGGGRGMPAALIEAIREAVLGDFRPDLTLYLDIPPQLGLERAAVRGELDRIEQQQRAFFERTHARYRQLVAADANAVTIDASRPLDEVQLAIRQALQNRLRA